VDLIRADVEIDVDQRASPAEGLRQGVDPEDRFAGRWAFSYQHDAAGGLVVSIFPLLVTWKYG